MQKTKNITLRFLVSFLLLGLILFFFRGKLDAVWEVLGRVNPKFLFLIIGGWVIAHSLFALRLKLILQIQGISLSWPHAFYVVMLGLFFNNLIPTLIGGDVAKWVYLSRSEQKNEEPFSALFLNRIVGLSTLLSLGIATILFFPVFLGDKRIVITFLFGFLFCGSLVFFFSHKELAKKFKFLWVFFPFEKAQDFFSKSYKMVHQAWRYPRLLGSAIAISFLGHIVIVSLQCAAARVLLLDIPISVFFVLFPLVSFAFIAPTINGIGAREAMYLFYLSAYCRPEDALAYSFLIDFIIIFVALLGGVLFACRAKLGMKT